jgi:hypothetical protein
VVGAGRSGTTLLRLMLDAHPRLAIPPETHFIPRLAEAFPEGELTGEGFAAALESERRWGDFGLDAAELAAELGDARPVRLADALRAFYAAYARARGKERWGDKTPGYSAAMVTIQGLLPEAHFIHLIRDGRDVAVASAERNGRPLRKTIRVWGRHVSDARAQRVRLRHYTELRFEDLVSEPEAQLRRLCEYLDLEWDPAMLAYHRRAGERLAELGDLPGRKIGGRPATAELRRSFYELNSQPPQPAEIGRWREAIGEADAAEIEREAGGLLAELGYGG